MAGATRRDDRDALQTKIADFLDERVFGPERAALLTAGYPASTAASTARKDKETARLNKRLRQIDAAEDAHPHELEALTDSDQPHNSAPVRTYRCRDRGCHPNR